MLNLWAEPIQIEKLCTNKIKVDVWFIALVYLQHRRKCVKKRSDRNDRYRINFGATSSFLYIPELRTKNMTFREVNNRSNQKDNFSCKIKFLIPKPNRILYWFTQLIDCYIDRNSIHSGPVVIQLAKQNAVLVIRTIVRSCRPRRFILIECNLI